MKGSAMDSSSDRRVQPAFRGPEAFAELRRREQSSSEAFLNQPNFVPGLFQTRGYATEMISRTAGLEPGSAELAARVEQRLERARGFAERLRGGTRATVVVDEATLQRVIGGRQAMREQLDHLRALIERPGVTLGIVPLEFGAHAGLIGSFEVHDDVVFVESPVADELYDDRDEAQRFRERVEGMLASARSGADARSLLEAISRGL